MKSTESNFAQKKLSDWYPALICLSLSFIFLVYLTFSPTGKTELAVVYLPGTEADEGFARTINAGAYATGVGGFDNIVLVTVSNEELSDEVISQLYENGALVVINGIASGGCFS
jgi:hypothetical protein|tara:strand:- start:178671 stop:179012 length:342 start_codon:yes stop_codon:yes gene_type:complete